MLKFIPVIAALLIPCCSVVIASPSEPEQVEALVRERLAASWRADRTTWRRHISDACVWVGPGLLVGTTADAESEQVGSKEKLELKDFQVRNFGPELVIATYLAVASRVTCH
jgi:hypothetical protein